MGARSNMIATAAVKARAVARIKGLEIIISVDSLLGFGENICFSVHEQWIYGASCLTLGGAFTFRLTKMRKTNMYSMTSATVDKALSLTLLIRRRSYGSALRYLTSGLAMHPVFRSQLSCVSTCLEATCGILIAHWLRWRKSSVYQLEIRTANCLLEKERNWP